MAKLDTQAPTEADPIALKPAQQRRVLALKEARQVLAGTSFMGSGAVESSELIRVADYIIEGEV
jgi:hypothetical protein